MNSKTILGISLATVFVVSMIPVYAVVAGYVVIEDGSVSSNKGTFKGTADTGANIPRFDPSVLNAIDLIFGYGWVDLATGEAFLAAIHPDFKDSAQNPNGWHTHPVTLSVWDFDAGQFCIEDLRSSQGGWSINKDVMKVNVKANAIEINADEVDAVVSFTASVDSDCPEFTVDNHVNPFGPAQVKVQVTSLFGLP